MRDVYVLVRFGLYVLGVGVIARGAYLLFGAGGAEIASGLGVVLSVVIK